MDKTWTKANMTHGKRLHAKVAYRGWKTMTFIRARQQVA
jgi:hypothetical protein